MTQTTPIQPLPRRATRVASLIASITLPLTLVTGCGSAEPAPSAESASPTAAPATVAELDYPVTISHRGGSLVYPEESMEGFTASAKDGFLPEMDIQFLSDGTPVLIHDDTADRTLTGAEGKIRDLDRDDWDAAKITHPTGGTPAETVTLEELLDELGETTVLVPEIKPGATSAEVNAVLDEFDARDLQDSLIVQSFDWEAATTIADRGYTSLYLFEDTMPAQSPDDIAEAGIGWVGPSRELPATDMATLSEASLKVAPYGLTTAADIRALPEGVSGWFTDDPWDE